MASSKDNVTTEDKLEELEGAKEDEAMPLSSPPAPEMEKKGQESEVCSDGDEPDAISTALVLSWLELGGIVLSIFSFIFDLGMDVVVTTFLYMGGHLLEFGLTLAFIVIPTVVSTFFSLKWYIDDSRDNIIRVSPLKWALRVLFLVLQMGPILRYISSLSHGIKGRTSKSKLERKKHYKLAVFEDADAALLQLFQAFLEDAPQLILQISILADPHLRFKSILVQRLSLVSSLLGISWTLVSQHRALRLAVPRCSKMTWIGTIFLFFWRLFTIASRMLTLGLFASVFPIPLAIVCVVRWILMTSWIVTMKTTFCQTSEEPQSSVRQWLEYLYNGVLGVIFLFCYFNPKDTPTRWRYIIYYSYTLVENTFLITFWYLYCHNCSGYNFVVLTSQMCSFFIGLAFMVVYYVYLHPTGRIRICPGEKQEEREMTDTANYREAGCYTISLTLNTHRANAGLRVPEAGSRL